MTKRARAIGVAAAMLATSVAAMSSGGSVQAESTIDVGAASRSVLPTVDGSHDYLDALVVDPEDPYSPGIPVPAWDQGRVAVGNGASAARWVHDDMRVSAVAFQEPNDEITVVVAANLYMIFRGDGEEIREAVAERLPTDVADRVEIAIHADHNHHGPDTAFDVNHEWYDLMVDQAADAVVEAIDQMEPAELEVAETDHWFGLRDSRDVQVVDPTVGVLRATAVDDGETIATLTFWGNHPEVTLFWSPPADAIADDCVLLGLEGDDCSAEDAYFTADFPGWTNRILHDELGGEALFINGAVGDLITPLGADVWEVNDDAPLGNGFTIPEGAAPPIGAANYTERNFRRTYLVGRELAHAALDALEDAQPLTDTSIDYDTTDFYTRMSNIGFRLLLAVDPDTGRTALGHNPFELFNCPAIGEKSDATCASDEFSTEADPLLGTIRSGDHVKSQVSSLRIGPIGTMWLPAEVGPESTIGLPAGYDENPGQWHLDDPSLHAFGEENITSGYVKNRMDTEYRWIVGLGNDQLGYAVPLSDYRVFCVADALAGEGTCQALYDAGVIEFPDAVAGSTCKAITEDPSLLVAYGSAAEAVAGSCRYGQAFDESLDHYEETNSAGWDLEADILASVAELTGNADPARINPAFPGYYAGFPQPILPSAVTTSREMVVTANPLATAAGEAVLADGGTAVDAMVAVQAMLGLVEPQSSGMGGGAFVVYYDAKKDKLTTYDARETAPSSATADRFAGRGFFDAWQSGLSVGVPGVPALLEEMHDEHGRRALFSLVAPAAMTAWQGFPLSQRTSDQVAALSSFGAPFFRDPTASEYFLNPDGTAKPAGTVMTNRDYAMTLWRFGKQGADAFYTGRVARDIVDAVNNDPNGSGGMSRQDLRDYEVIQRDAVCVEYRSHEVCGMGPPSSGGLAVGQILGILENFDVGASTPTSLETVHVVTQASRLAFADRNQYVADSDFVDVPVEGMLDPDYLAARAELIDLEMDMGTAAPGTPPGVGGTLGADDVDTANGTSHVSIIDRYGNALSMTTTVESSLGNGVMVQGFLLNNQLTDFSFRPETPEGEPIANRVEPNKRPRSSMSPTIVFDADGEVKIVTGSPGGSRIIGYTAQSIINMIDFGLDPQEAINTPHFLNRNGSTDLEAPLPGVVGPDDVSLLEAELEALGHSVNVRALTSGLSIIQVTDDGLLGGADFRRDGAVGGS
ncbi:MAG: gamma-glutamyltransferase [Ilumatobacter sp.]